jgi:hypothetical protein
MKIDHLNWFLNVRFFLRWTEDSFTSPHGMNTILFQLINESMLGFETWIKGNLKLQLFWISRNLKVFFDLPIYL